MQVKHTLCLCVCVRDSFTLIATWETFTFISSCLAMLQKREAVNTFSAFFHSDGGELFSGATALSKQTFKTFFLYQHCQEGAVLCGVVQSLRHTGSDGNHQVIFNKKFSALK